MGQQTEKDLIAMGYTTLESLKGKKAEDLYREECALRGVEIDRCQLYLYRAVEYFVNTENPDPEKCKWWFWKDDFAQPSPCGAVCTECDRFPKECGAEKQYVPSTDAVLSVRSRKPAEVAPNCPVPGLSMIPQFRKKKMPHT